MCFFVRFKVHKSLFCLDTHLKGLFFPNYAFLTKTFKKRTLFLTLIMAISQLRSKRKASGGRYKRVIVKRLGRQGRLPVLTKLASRKRKTIRVIGGSLKEKLLSDNQVNVFDAKTRKHTVLDIKTIVENPANRHYVRRNILTKGCLVETEKGKVRITSRPGQEAVLNGVFVE
jgi:small subunit ribosomal protein S8e